MIYQFLRVTVNCMILSGLLLAAFGFGGAFGKTMMEVMAPNPQEETFLLPQAQSQIISPIQTRRDDQRPISQTPAPTPIEGGFIPYRIPIPLTGDSAGVAPPAAPAGSPTGVPLDTPEPPAIPDRIVIPKIGLDAPIVLSPQEWVQIEGKTYEQWQAPNTFAAGWQESSAMPGQMGNFILNGHHNIKGKVFGHLIDLNKGDVIAVFSGERMFGYYVSQVVLFEERDVSLAQREKNAVWIRPTADERLTLVTCWPPESNTHRLIIIALPAK
jgi:LPXTG-site transpeptidase (sortase) family protein